MEGFDFPVEVIRTPRKRSAAIQVSSGVVSVRVPQSLSDKRIQDLIQKRSVWIKRKIKEQADRPTSKPKEYVSGESFSYLGKTHRLKVVDGAEPSLKMKGGRLVASVPKDAKNRKSLVESLVTDWYQSHADQKLREKVKRFAPIVGVEPRSIAVKAYKARWGSCTSSGDISFNWKIIEAPHRVVDYVVIHELCHMLEHNHSPKYWKHVERYVPDWQSCRHWLKHNLQPSL